MTVYTSDGLQWLRQRNIDNSLGPIDKIAVGSGTQAEDKSNTTLESPIYASTTTYDNVSVQSVEGYDGRLEFVLAIKGGTEISGGTEIREMGVFVNGTTSGDHDIDSNDRLIVRDVFPPIQVVSGHTIERTLTVDYEN